ncbi:MAG TPA: Sec-independent protein translocase protein TatB [Dehalococcoidia bacterium]|nr:Sec-independent protein translocase protein TatB [Dehalococcoidia bacterium]
MQFFGIGPLELLLVAVVALLVLGPQRLPEAAVQLARFIRTLRRYAASMTAEFRQEFQEVLAELEEVRAEVQGLRQALREQAQQVQQEAETAYQPLRESSEAALGALEGSPPPTPAVVETTAEPAPDAPAEGRPTV